jgi:transcriptional regulator with XRE-family HTH domain
MSSSNITTTAEVRAALESLGHAQLQELAELSGVSFTTLWSIRSGERKNPGIQTVADFMACIEQARGGATTT